MSKLLVVDYAFQHPTIAQLKAAGVYAVGRYFGEGSQPPKFLDHSEASELSQAGIRIISLFEYGAKQALLGAKQAYEDIRVFRQQARSVAPPDGHPIRSEPCYFAADFDVPDFAPHLSDTPSNARAKLGPLADYWYVIQAERGLHLSAAYGGYWLIKRLFDAQLITYGFQTVAWSGGHIDTRAQLYQNGSTAFGGSADVDVEEHHFGSWTLTP